MEYDHSPGCYHCQLGCVHPHDDDGPLGDYGVGPCIPTVAGSTMRNGGYGYDETTGVLIGSDQWLPVRCKYCKHEARTPIEAVPPAPFQVTDTDGAILTICGPCKHDLRTGRRPGHTRHTRRRRRTAR